VATPFDVGAPATLGPNSEAALSAIRARSGGPAPGGDLQATPPVQGPAGAPPGTNQVAALLEQVIQILSTPEGVTEENVSAVIQFAAIMQQIVNQATGGEAQAPTGQVAPQAGPPPVPAAGGLPPAQAL
jgi:hypothetical protein